jgi:hypothetical protein
VDARGGSDDVSGGNGNDLLLGDGSNPPNLDGSDDVFGDDGDDYLQAYGGSDYLSGDDDEINARDSFPKGTDTVRGDSGDDTIDSVDGVRDRIRCGTGNDEVTYDNGIDAVAADCEERFPQ